MSENIPISYIRIGETDYPINAVTLNGEQLPDESKYLPVVTNSEDGKMLGVETGEWMLFDPSDIYDEINGLPVGDISGDSDSESEIPSHDYSHDYLTFEILGTGTIGWYATGSTSTKTIQYSVNDGTWTSITAGSDTISVSEGDIVRFKGTNNAYTVDKNNYSGFGHTGTATYNVSGNIMSLIYGDNFLNQTSLPAANAFWSLFDTSNVVNAENLILPATTLSDCCYRAMFANCSLLRTAPALPATTLVDSCYRFMFQGCVLMTTAPDLLAPTLVTGCYYGMFSGASSLNYIRCLATNPASTYIASWTTDVAPTGTFRKDINAQWIINSADGIPRGWTPIDEGTQIVATPTITCVNNMVTFNCDTPNATIYYRLGGSGSYLVYNGPIEIQDDTLVEVYASKNGVNSTVVSETCTYVDISGDSDSDSESEETVHNYAHDYLTLDIITGGNLLWKAEGSDATKTIEYSINDGEWTSVTSTTSGVTIPVSAGDQVRVKGTNSRYCEANKNNYSRFGAGSATFNISGNMLSLIYGDNFIGQNTVNAYSFTQFFKESKPVSAENLVLLASSVPTSGYRAMFSKCTTLVTAPKELPATTLGQQCYYYMFENCAITAAPILPNATQASECYGYMFTGCSDLCYIKCLSTSPSTTNCKGWTTNVAPVGTFVKDDNTTWSTGVNGIPTSWVQVNVSDEDIHDGGESESESEEDYGSDVPLLRGWKYSGNDIDLPYSVNALNGQTSNYSKGVYSFNSEIVLDEINPTYLWFNQASQTADVYIDNQKVGTHWGGYNSFFMDITNYVHRGVNQVLVALNNTTRNTIAPAAGDFNFNATLGEVKLLSSPVVPDPSYGYDGFHISSTVTSASAAVTITTSIPNTGTVVLTIDDGTYHYTDTVTDTGTITFTHTITNPHLWNGRLDPHLYNITLDFYHDGTLYHTFTRPYGFRYFSYVWNDSNVIQNETYTGFLLNGQPYLLRGVCMHQDLQGKANALTYTDIQNDFSILNELNCNFIRTAHYPHPKEFYDLCDYYGIIVQTEVPCVNKFQSSMPSDYYTHLEGQYRDMVNEHYNHPSIIFWGLGNEIATDDASFANTKLNSYAALIRSIDSSRWIGYVVSHSYPNGLGTFNYPNVDWIGQNLYVGWYLDQSSNNPANRLNTCLNNANNANTPMAYSEYGCGGNILCHSDSPLTTTTRGNNPRHDIEFQMWLHEGHIQCIKNYPQLLFSSQWVLFDFAVSSRNEGYVSCIDGVTEGTDDTNRYLNDKGLVKRDHQTKKDTFYLYKAWWNQTDKFVHICQKNYQKYTDRVIKCYTNETGSLSLYVNNTLIETKAVSNYIAEFTARNFYKDDVIRVSGSNSNDTLTMTDAPVGIVNNTITLTATEDTITATASNNVASTVTITLTGDISDTITIASGQNTVTVNIASSPITRTCSLSILPVSDSTYNYILDSNSVTVPATNYETKYLTIVSTSDNNTIGWKNNSGSVKTISISTDGGQTWIDKTSIYNGETLATLNTGDKMLIKGSNNSYYTEQNYHGYYSYFTSTDTFNVEGNIMSMIYGDNFAGQITLSDSNTFNSLFKSTNIVNAGNLVLPATTLSSGCYTNMFEACTSLTTAPILPATTLTNYCYLSMFEGCTSLTTTSTLPATTLSESCYFNMFSGCISLTSAPTLPATTLASSCYYGMFSGCTSLTSAPTLPATTLASSCYYGMFSGCTSLTTVPTLSATTLASSCYYNMFNGCTSLTTVPTLSATTLATYCYQYMFKGCTSLTSAPTLSATTLTESCYYGMFSGCTSLTTVPTLSATTLADSCYYGMFSGCTSLTTVPTISATTLARSCYREMFSGCTNLTTVPTLPATTLADSCYYGMFSGCTNLTTVPTLPATTLVQYCYKYMFSDCTSLTTAPELPATTLANGCYESMFSSCTGLTTAPTLPATTLIYGCYESMFFGCTGLITSPVLPATTLATLCYEKMFQNCTNLNQITCLATNISAQGCTYKWVDGVAVTGTFIKNPSMSNWTYGINGIPIGWGYMSTDDSPIAWGESTYELPINGIIKPILGNPYNLSVTYSSSDTDVATIDNNGNVTFVDEGTCTLTAVFAGDGTYSAKTVTCTLTVTGHSYEYDYLTIVSTSNNNSIYFSGHDLIVSTDNGQTWTKKEKSISSVTLATLNVGDKLLIKGNENAYYTDPSISSYGSFNINGTFNVEGNIMSMIYGDDFVGPKTLSRCNMFYQLFRRTNIVDAHNLILPATILTEDCYKGMFVECTNLTTSPAILPATTLSQGCYQGMFASCSNLITTPELPATKLVNDCYYTMFSGCTSLTTSPVLPATTLVSGCYQGMFSGCTSLNQITCLATNISASNCTNIWVSNVAATGLFIMDSSMPNWTIGNNGIPTGWVIFTENADELPIRWNESIYTLAINSVNSVKPILMNPYNLSVTYTSSDTDVATIDNNGNVTLVDEGTCTLTASFAGDGTYEAKTVTCTLTVTGYSYEYDYLTIVSTSDNNTIGWKGSESYSRTISISTDNGQIWTSKTSSSSGVTLATLNTGDRMLIKGNSNTYSPNGNYYSCFTSTGTFNAEGNIMSMLYGDNFAGQTTLSATYTFSYLFSSTKIVNAGNLILPATTLTEECYLRMFQGCTSLTTPPITLPATTLANYCYNQMFSGCTSLTTAPELPATTLASNSYYYMFSGCTSLNQIMCLTTNLYNNSNLYHWVQNVATTGIFFKNSLTTRWTTGSDGIPTGWIVYNYDDLPIWWKESTFTLPINTNSTSRQLLLNPLNVSITCTSSDTDVATIDNNGNVTFVDEGTCTLTAVFAGDDTYSAKTVTCTLTVTGYSYEYDYLTIVSTSDNNTIGWKFNGTGSSKTISVSTDNGQTWTDKTSTTNGVTLATLNTGGKMLIKGSNNNYGSYYNYNYYNYFTSTDTCNVEGNIMSMINGDDFVGKTTLSSTYTFLYLFGGTSNLINIVNAGNLILPVTTLTESCYSGMFRACHSLTIPPALPATILVTGCYYDMFNGCTSLTTAPELPATTLASNCYQNMFYNCTSLTTAPELPATTLESSCYSNMFYGCTSLTTAPTLSATTLASSCYYGMFQGCSNLNQIICLATDISASGCLTNWVSGVASIGAFVKDSSMTDWTINSVNGIPVGWTIISNTELPICWSESTYTIPINFDRRPVFINPYNLSVTCTSSDTNVATIDNSGNVTFVDEGTCTLTAVFAGNDIYSAKTVTCTLTVAEYSYEVNYLTIVSTSNNNTIGWKVNSSNSYAKTISISTDNGQTWTDKKSNTSGVTLATLNTGDKMLIKGNNSTYGDSSSSSYYNYFTSGGTFNVEGNIMSMLYGDNFIGQTTLSVNYTFNNLFRSTRIVNAGNLVLPSTSLRAYCYYNMFYGCTSLTTAPVILPATTLETYCYSYMFYNCTGLTTAPELPATTLVNYCYYYMFYGCTHLNQITCLATDISASNCLTSWVYNVASTGTFIKNSTMTSWITGVNGIPTGWTIISNTELPICWSESTYSLPINSTIKPVFLNPFNVSVTYTSSDTDVATIDNNGNITFVDEGTCTLTASFVGDGTYSAKNATCTLTVTGYSYEYDYLTIVSTSDNNTIGWKSTSSSSSYRRTISVSTDNGQTWTSKTSSTSGVTLATLNTGDKMLIKGSNSYYYSSGYYNYFTSTGTFNIEGNIMSMINGDDFAGKTTLSSSYTFSNLFNSAKIVNAGNLILPATTLAQYCYYYMFQNCTSLTTAPELPATTLVNYCYYYMFYGCTSLTTAPELPATTLVTYCYYGMFYNCTGLTTAPELPATTLANYCYQSMFYGCSSLTTAPELPATTLANYCYQSMFYGCSSLTTAPELPATTLATYCYYNMFYGCTSLTTAPELPATTLATYCYYNMFYNCTSLTTAPELPATTLANYCYYYMFYGCTSLNQITCLATNISASNCLTNWVSNVAATGIFIKDSTMTSWTTGVNGIPLGWVTINYDDLPIYWKESTFTLPINTNSTSRQLLLNPLNVSITCTSSDTDVAIIDNNGNITFVDEGTCTLTAVFAGDGTYEAKTVTCTLTVTEYSYSGNYLTIVSTSDNNTIGWTYNSNTVRTISISTDNGQTWTSKTSAASIVTLATLNTGDKMLIKGNNTEYSTGTSYYNYFTSTGTFNAEGNMMSMIYGDNFIGQTTLSANYTFYRLFGNTNIVNAGNLILPATTLTSYCYYNMFYGCTSLTTSPVILPATTLATYCYYNMFSGCSSLTTAPELPATTLAQYCYYYMFYGCTSLTTAPELPATTLVNYCYYYMFSGCTGLTTAPVLPATTLPTYCYSNMFQSCSNLNQITCLATNISASNCLTGWVNNVSPIGTFIKDSTMTSWPTGVSGIPSGWIVINDDELPIKWKDSTYTLPINANNSLRHLLLNPYNVSITCTSSDTGVATIDNNGNITFVDEGTCTLTAVFAGDDTYSAKTTTCTLTVTGYSSESNYFTIVSTSDNNTIAWKAGNSNTARTISISTDNGQTWNSVTASTYTDGGTLATLNTGDRMLIKGKTSTYASGSSYYNYFTSTGTFNIEGNIMTMIYGDDFIGQTTLSSTYTFYKLFNSTNIVNAGNLILPTTILTDYCYSNMFYGCSSLTTAPELPATTLASNCYRNMFQGCTSLTTVPALPATTLTSSCYRNMFQGCTSLTTAPTLSATTLAESCYCGMFQGCTGLTSVPALPATTLTNSCYDSMFYGCTSLTTAPTLSATTLANACYEYMFYGCTSLTTSPTLPVTTLVTYCYYGMFQGCTGLTSAPALPATTLTNSCYDSMFYGCTSLTTAPTLSATTLAESCYQYMFQGCTGLTSAPALPVTTLATNCYYGMFQGCTGLTSAPALPADTLVNGCYYNMFNGCTGLTSAPALSATTLATNCYYGMFQGCTGLTSAPVLPATTLATYCYYNMFYGCTSLTSAPELPAATLTQYCYYQMFYGCTNLNQITCLATNMSESNCLTNWVSNVAESGLFVMDNSMPSWTTGDSGIPTDWNTFTGSVNELPIKWKDSTYTLPINDIRRPVFLNPYNVSVTFTSSDNTVATIDNNGSVTFEGEGICTLTASFAGDDTYSTKNAVCTLTVTEYSLEANYLTITSSSDNNTIGWKMNSYSAEAKIISVSTDNGQTWTSYQSAYNEVTLATLNNGDKLLIKGSNSTYASSSSYYNYFTSTGTFNLEGNIMSMIYGDDFCGQTTLSSSYTFSHLFLSSKVVNAGNLVLPATTLVQYCYSYMFQGCTSLTTTPALPVTTLANYCYYSMFSSCTGLTSAPALPATTLAQYCYSYMFYNCSSLTTSPELPATTLAQYCYQYMFQGCTNLNQITCLATSIATGALTNWVSGVANTGVFIKNPLMNNWTIGVNGIPNGWAAISTDDLPIAWGESTYSLPINSVNKPILANPYNLSVTYTSSDTNVATIDNNGNVTLVGEGTCTLTAVFAGDGTYESKTTTCTLIVTGYSYEMDYLTIVSTSDNNTISWKFSNSSTSSSISSYRKYVYVSTNNGQTWTSYQSAYSAVTLATLNNGDKLLIKGSNSTYASSSSYYNYFTSTGTFNLEGNIMSMIYGDDFVNKTTLSSTYTFYYLFGGVGNRLIDAGNLVLPATTLANYCYYSMFQNCTGLTTAPVLPATTLTTYCYCYMFYGCTSLTTAPALPATTLATYCYYGMFQGCSSLTTAPELPVTTLASNCYRNMFQDCTSLTTAPVLPADTLVNGCYQYMFQGCTHLNQITCLATNISASGCLTGWVSGVASIGAFVKDSSMTGWTINSTSGIPTGWTVVSSDEVPVWSESTYTIPINTHNKPILINPFNVSLTCTSSDTDVATIDNNGNVTFVGEGTCTLTAVFAGDGTYEAKTTTCTLIVTGYSYEIDYLTIISTSDNNTIGWKVNSSNSYERTISISTDNGQTWTSKTSTTSGVTLATLNTGDRMLIKGSNNTYCNPSSSSYYNYFTSTDTFNAEGNIMSMIYGDNFIGQTTLSTNYTFYNLFRSSKVVNAGNLVLPATTLATYCYSYMFYGCTSLTTAPVLPATTLTNSCYYNMFTNCSSLTTAPSLPATTLETYCYSYMFYGCTSLTTAPELPATTLVTYCYSYMFYGCTSLTTAPELPATTLTIYCYSNMFRGCTSLTTAPEFPATTLAEGCYREMFFSCIHLNQIICLATDISASNCLTNWVSGVAPIGTFIKNPSISSWTTGNNGIPTGWEIIDAELPIWFKTSTYTLPIDANNELTQLLLNPYNLSLACTSSDNNVATIDNNGNVTLVDEGTCTLTASFAGDDTYSAKTVTCTLTVTEHSYECNYLTIVSTSDNNTIGWKVYDSSYAKTISISTDNGQTWTSKTSTTSGVTLATLNTGDKMLIKGNNTTYCVASSYYNQFTSTGTFNAEGNIMSMIYGNNFIGKKILSVTYTFSKLFNSTNIVNAGNLVLPATTLAQYCYYYMFNGCTSLTTAPVLPATTLVNYCYYYMFYDCTSLNQITCLATDISASNCLSNWVYNVASTGTFVKDPLMTGWTIGTSGIPKGWGSMSTDDLPIAWGESTYSLPINGIIKPILCNPFNLSVVCTSSDTNVATIDNNGNVTFVDEGTCTLTAVFAGDDTYSAKTVICTLIVEGYSYECDYLTITSVSDNNTIGWKADGSSKKERTISISTDNGQTWTSKTSSSSGVTLATLNTGDRMLIKGSTSGYGSSGNYSYHNFFTSTGTFDVEGNIMSMIYGDDFYGQTRLSGTYAFLSLFGGTKIVNAGNLVLPATTLGNYCYYNMFNYCSNMITAPTILPSTTLASNCYRNMFQACTSLTTAPILPATTLVDSCYYYMFGGCTSLNWIKCLATNISASSCLNSWVSNVASTGTFIANNSTVVWPTGAHGIPTNWTIQYANIIVSVIATGNTIIATTDDIVASTITVTLSGDLSTTVTINSGEMFGIASITPSNVDRLCSLSVSPESDSTYNYVLNSNNVTIPAKNNETSYLTIISTSDNNTIGWQTNDNNLTRTISVSTDNGQTWTDKTSTTNGVTLATLNTGDRMLIKGSNTTYASSSITYNHFTSTGTFDAEGNMMSMIYGDNFIGQTILSGAYVFGNLFDSSDIVNAGNLVLPTTSLVNHCYYGMFQDCTSLTTAPVLPAATLAQYCYYNMFSGCTSLNQITCLATDISASNCLINWVYNVAATGTFIKDGSMTGWPTGGDGIPSGWTVRDYGVIDTITITATFNTITATATSAVTSTTTVTLSGDLSTTITINSGETTGTTNITPSNVDRICNLSISPNDYVLSSNTVTIPQKPSNTITVTATDNTVTATASSAVTSVITVTLSGDLSTTVTIASGSTSGTVSITESNESRTCNLSVSPAYDSSYNYVLSSSTLTIPSNNPSRLPSGYQELQYISSNRQLAAFYVTYTLGTDAGFKLRCHCHQMDESSTSAFTAFCGVYRPSGGYVDHGIGISASTSSSNQNILRIYQSPSNNCNLNYNFNGEYIQEASLINGLVTKFDGTTQSGYTWGASNSYLNNCRFGIFAHYNLDNSALIIDSNRGSKTIAYFALYNGSTITYEFIPAKRLSDNKIGMYDLVNDVFYSSTTGTEFIAGPEV